MTFTLDFGLSATITQTTATEESSSCRLTLQVDEPSRREQPDALHRQLCNAARVCCDVVHAQLIQNLQSARPARRSTRGSSPAPEDRRRVPLIGTTESAGSRDHSKLTVGLRTVKSKSKVANNPVPDKPATRGQRRALRLVCLHLNVDPAVAAGNHHFQLSSLTNRQASLLIHQLRRLQRSAGRSQSYLARLTWI